MPPPTRDPPAGLPAARPSVFLLFSYHPPGSLSLLSYPFLISVFVFTCKCPIVSRTFPLLTPPSSSAFLRSLIPLFFIPTLDDAIFNAERCDHHRQSDMFRERAQLRIPCIADPGLAPGWCPLLFTTALIATVSVRYTHQPFLPRLSHLSCCCCHNLLSVSQIAQPHS